MPSLYLQDNNLKTRRNLRGQIERRSLEINTDFLSAFKGCVVVHFKLIESHFWVRSGKLKTKISF